MKLDRIGNSVKNLTTGIMYKVLVLLTNFLLRTVIIYKLGVEYLGLGSLFNSILTVLNLTELGFSSALVFSMYKPIADDDVNTICALMCYYKKIYRIIGMLILILGICILPFIDKLIFGGVPKGINIYYLYLISLSGTVITYFMYAYRNCLLMAYQRNDISNIINIIFCIPQTILQIFIIWKYKNYYVYMLITPIFMAIVNIGTAIYVKKIFPQYIPKGNVKREMLLEIKQKVRGLFVYKIGNVVSGSVDNVVISAFLGLNVLGIYNNYYYIVNTLFGFFLIYYNAISAGIGNSVALESKEKNFKDFKKLLFIQGWSVGWCSICLVCLFQNFMSIWIGTKLMLPDEIVFCFVIYFYVWKIQDIVNVIKEAVGMWNQDKWRPLISSSVNLGLNLLLVNKCGLYGVILSTVAASLLVGLPWASRVLFKNYYEKSTKIYYLLLLKYTVITLMSGSVTYAVCSLLPRYGWKSMIEKLLICITLPNIFYYFIYRNNEQFKAIKVMVKGYISK